MNHEPVWILETVLFAIHDRQLEEHGGAAGVRDEGLLQSAINAPKQRFHYEQSPIEELAACYAYHLVKNHPFVDGNKRTAYVCMRLFLNLNGYELAASKEEKVTVMLDLAAGELEFDKLNDWIKKTMKLLP